MRKGDKLIYYREGRPIHFYLTGICISFLGETGIRGKFYEWETTSYYMPRLYIATERVYANALRIEPYKGRKLRI